ncbi:MAG: exodeoxyribonuclease VII small subunit [Gemmatimonadetes bacterium 13_1_40CM_4_69_8]|nr:MAG: exodeoxyribonuclease VII small subunit [Gemmatimonadetes bacterium 13_1_40CM_70_15]OLC73323.1 MAG: exodeoxyribonuclease VII small subunit [Gemmatimonadetes bacterium 13_1_40CM_4_69_8]PYP74024.1 MAG: exodeoxyribonuclease VII small subunit [Gemmatimonadota bacterium]
MPESEAPEFGRLVERLEEIVRRLEAEDLDLDEALKLFEEGVERLRDARQRLARAEATVKKVLRVEDLDR